MKANEQQDLREGLRCGFGWMYNGEPAICLMIPPSCFIEGDDGEPRPGIAMTAAQAREIAYMLLLQAEQLASGSAPIPPKIGIEDQR